MEMAFTGEDKKWMEAAISQALQDPRKFKLGATIVRNGVILKAAHGGEHRAELSAIGNCLSRQEDLTGSTLDTILQKRYSSAFGSASTMPSPSGKPATRFRDLTPPL